MKIYYIFKTYNGESNGIEKKILDIANAISNSGHQCSVFTTKKTSLKSTIEIFRFIFRSDGNIYIIRNFPPFVSLLAPIILIKRLLGSRFILDIPTPLSNYIVETSHLEQKKHRILLKKYLTYALSPITNLVFNRILQYAPDSKYFSIFARKKTLITSNGINVKSTPIPPPRLFTGTLRLITVAHIQFWHGIDRLINSIHYALNTNPDLSGKIQLTIVGDGDGKSCLLSLVDKLQLQDIVTFAGKIAPEKLASYFANSDIGVCSLGLHRKNLNYASQLKAREYAAHGLPFILAGVDPDFQIDQAFVFRVKNDESLIDINAIYNSYITLITKNPNLSRNIRTFAEENLDHSNKIKENYLNFK